MQAYYIHTEGSSATSEILSLLTPNERLLWSGKPLGGVRFQVTDIVAIPFSLLYVGFFVFWAWMVIPSDAPLFFKLPGVAFLLLGLYTLAGRFFVDAMRRAHTSYGVTDSRVIIVTNWPGKRTQSLNLRALPQMELSLERNGAGTINFGAPPAWAWLLAGNMDWMGMGPKGPGFRSISRAREVYDLINQAQAAARRPEA